MLRVGILVFLCLAFETAFSQSSEEKLRIHVLPLSTSSEEAVVTAVMTAADTTALTLRLLGEYEVTEIRSTAPADARDYLDGTEPGELDRLLTLSINPLEGGYEIRTTVIDPLTEEQLVGRSLEVDRALDLFAATDELLQQVLGELSGRRIAFGEILFDRGVWRRGAIDDVDWGRLDLFDDNELEGLTGCTELLEGAVGNNVESDSPFEYRVDGAALNSEEGSSQRVLIGERSVSVYQQRFGAFHRIQETTMKVGENERVTVTAEPPILTQAEAATLNARFTEINAAGLAAQESGNDADQRVWLNEIGQLRRWCDSAAEEIPAFAGVADRIEVIELAANVETIRFKAEHRWAEPREEWLDTVTELKRQAEKRGESASVMVAGHARRTADALLQIHALSHIRHLREDEWQPLVNGYNRLTEQVETHGLQPPRWLVDDTNTIDAILRRYEKDSRNRPGLYRALTWGGATMALAGGGAWGWGFSTAMNNEELYNDYQATDDPREAESLREDLESDRELANILQAGGIGAVATGVAGVVTGTIIQRRDRRVPERDMVERLESHFGERLAYDQRLQERERLNLGLFRFEALE